MTETRARRFASPCRTGTGPRRHHCSPAHADLVEGYRAWREYAEAEAEAASIGYATELDEYWDEHPRPTFAAYLSAMRGGAQ